MASNMLMETLRNLFFGDKAEEWNGADDAGKAQILEEEGLSDYTVEDLTEAVTLMAEELPPEQVALLSPPVNNQVQAPVDQDSSAVVSGPEVVQNVGGDTNVAGGNIGDSTTQVATETNVSGDTHLDAAPAPAPAPAPHAGAAGVPAGPPPAPPVYEGDPAEVMAQTVNYYVTNVTNNVDQSTFVDDRDTRIDNSTNLEGDIYAEGDVELEFDNDVQTAGDGAVQLGEDAKIEDSALATGAGAVAAGGDVDGVITGDVTDSTIVQGDVEDSAVTGNVEGVVAVDSDVAGVNTGSVGGDMITNTGDGSVATDGSQVIDASGSSGDVNVATDGSEINDVDVDSGSGSGDTQVTVGDGTVAAQGSDAQAAGGDAIDADGNVNTGAGDQTNLEIGDISSGDDLNLNLQGEQNVQDTETNTDIFTENTTNIDTDIDTDIDIESNVDSIVDSEIDDSVVDSDIDDSVVDSNVDDAVVNSEGAAQADNGDAVGLSDSEINIDEEFTTEMGMAPTEQEMMPTVEEPPMDMDMDS